MSRTIRFHLDEHCDPAIAAGLRLHGVNVTSTAEAGLLHARDEEHLAYGVATGRVIFTQDQDFLRHHAAGVEHRGIAFCYQRSRSIGQIIASLLLIWEAYEPEEMANRVEYVWRRKVSTRVQAFVAKGSGCRATFFNYRQLQSGATKRDS